jgi:cell division protein FtsL
VYRASSSDETEAARLRRFEMSSVELVLLQIVVSEWIDTIHQILSRQILDLSSCNRMSDKAYERNLNFLLQNERAKVIHLITTGVQALYSVRCNVSV